MSAGHSQPRVAEVAATSDAMHGADAMDVRLVEAVAHRTAELVLEALERRPPRRLVDAAALAEALGVSRAHVYEHADELGAVRLGDGPRARLRFDVDAAIAARSRCHSEGSDESEFGAGTGGATGGRGGRVRRLPACLPAPGSVLRSRPADEEARDAA